MLQVDCIRLRCDAAHHAPVRNMLLATRVIARWRLMGGAAAHTPRRHDMAEAGTLHDMFIDELRDT
jgi:hypothetical protein